GSRQNLVLQHKPDDVPHEKHESIFGRNAEGHFRPTNHDVGVPVEELDELLQTPEAAFQAAQKEVESNIHLTFGLVVDVFQDDPDNLHQGQDQSSKCQRSHMGANEAGTYGERGDVVWFGKRPVVGRERPGEGALAQGNDKISTPEEGHHVVDLQVKQVPLEQALIIVFDENTPGLWGSRGKTGYMEDSFWSGFTRRPRGPTGSTSGSQSTEPLICEQLEFRATIL
uniref:Uncharacterized protein n=1 Tax=Takifugu rubripes TaxID=31033 RepID=H2RX44_TAKRU